MVTSVAGAPSEAGAPGNAQCEAASDCAEIETYPADCSETQCIEGRCVYVARDGDGDGFAAKRCQSQTTGVSVERGGDCDDGDASVSPNGWDGPAGDGLADGCNDDIDQDCSGLIDDGALEDGSTCVCSPGETRPCSTTPFGQAISFPKLDAEGLPVGHCRRGSQECLPNGSYGACVGAEGPATETCDGDDNDCDGVASVDDPSAVDRAAFACDLDSDGRLAGGTDVVVACAEPAEGCADGTWIRNPGAGLFDDCNDDDANVFRGNHEVCDKKDNDCDLEIDDDAIDEVFWSYDGDGDSYRSTGFAVLRQCYAPSGAPQGCSGVCPPDAWQSGGTPLPPGDCDDHDPARNPSAKDPCNGIDMNCDGSALTGCACQNNQTQTCGTHPGYDGKGICSSGTEKCTGGVWGSCVGSVAPEDEACGTKDRDCDGTIGNNDADAVDQSTWSCDGDLDGYLAPTATKTKGCVTPGTPCAGAWVQNPNAGLFTDCDDTDGNIHPGANERCNRLDDNCSSSAGQTTPALVAAEDADQDGHTKSTYTGCSGGYPVDDCNDNQPDVHPGQTGYFSEPYGCSSYCYLKNEGRYVCGFGGCSQIIFPYAYASFDYDCNGTEQHSPGVQAVCSAVVAGICRNSYSYTDDTVPCGQDAPTSQCGWNGSKCAFSAGTKAMSCR